eukprot:gene1668-1815_t
METTSSNLSKSIVERGGSTSGGPMDQFSSSLTRDIELAIAPLIKTCSKFDLPPPKYTIKKNKTVPRYIRLKEDLQEDQQHDLSVNCKTKHGTLRQLPANPSLSCLKAYFFSDSEISQHDQAEIEKLCNEQLDDISKEIFRFNLRPNSRSSTDITINNKMPLTKSLQQLRKFKAGLSPRKRLELVEARVGKDKSSEGGGVESATPQNNNLLHRPSTAPSPFATKQQVKGVVIRPDSRKALSLVVRGETEDPSIGLGSQDDRSFDNSQLGPLYSPTGRQRLTTPLNGMTPLLEATLNGEEGDSLTVDSYGKNQRDGQVHAHSHLELSEGSIGSLSSAPIEVSGGAIVRRKKKYVQAGEDLPQRPFTSPLPATAATTSPNKQTAAIKVPTANIQASMFKSDLKGGKKTEKNKVKSSHTDTLKAPLGCVKCYQTADLWCTQCVHAFCVDCWNRVPHHTFYDPANLPQARLHSPKSKKRTIVNSNQETNASPVKSYSNTVLFGEYLVGRTNNERRGNSAPAPVPKEIDFLSDPWRGKQIYMEKDGSVKMTMFDDNWDDHSPSRVGSPNRPPTHGRNNFTSRPTTAESNMTATVESSFHYTSMQGQDRQAFAKAEQRGKVAVRNGVARERPSSPAFSVDMTGFGVAYSRKPSAASAAIIGIRHDFQPVDWKQGLFQAKDPLGIANKHEMTDPEKPLATETFNGVPIRISHSR